MTRDEAIEAIKFGHCDDMYYRKEYEEAVDMAIKALEQGACEDAVSRQAVLDTLTKTSGIRGDALKALYDLPPVTPQPKTVLYSGDGYADGYMVYDMAECPKCGYEYEDGDKDWGLKFCPNCGQSLNWESEVEK